MARKDHSHLLPTFLPDGRHYVFYVNNRERGLYVGALGEKTKQRLFDPDPALPAGAAATPELCSSAERTRPDSLAGATTCSSV